MTTEDGTFFGYAFQGGEFKRPPTRFRDRVSSEPGAKFAPSAGRYHLYVSLACPWSHRTVLARRLRGLESVIGMSVTNPIWNENGWFFGDEPGAIPDTVNEVRDVVELYRKVDPSFSEPETVPILWDKKLGTIVSNESRDIVRMFDVAFDAFASGATLYPQELGAEIDRALDELYAPVNNGVYAAGFARTQRAYERAYRILFEALDGWERRLGERRFVCGERMTEADLALFVTLVRFDSVYYSHFKCNARRIVDYPNLWGWLREVYQIPGVAETTNFEHIKKHYYGSHRELNPSGIIPLGPVLDWWAPVRRGQVRG